jgi:hypothetical protein
MYTRAVCHPSLSFVFLYGFSVQTRMGRHNDRRPSSKLAVIVWLWGPPWCPGKTCRGAWARVTIDQLRHLALQCRGAWARVTIVQLRHLRRCDVSCPTAVRVTNASRIAPGNIARASALCRGRRAGRGFNPARRCFSRAVLTNTGDGTRPGTWQNQKTARCGMESGAAWARVTIDQFRHSAPQTG